MDIQGKSATQAIRDFMDLLGSQVYLVFPDIRDTKDLAVIPVLADILELKEFLENPDIPVMQEFPDLAVYQDIRGFLVTQVCLEFPDIAVFMGHLDIPESKVLAVTRVLKDYPVILGRVFLAIQVLV